MSLQMDRPVVADAIRCLADNAELIEALRDGIERKHDLAECLDVSNQTIYRRTRQLREFDLVERSHQGYQLTPIGELHARMILDAHDISERMYAGQRLLSDIGNDIPIPYWLLKDAEIVYPTRNAPYRPLTRIREKLSETTHLKGVLSTVIPQHIIYCAERINNDSLRAELVFESECIDELRAEFFDLFSHSVERENLALREVSDPIAFDLLFCSRSSRWTGIRVYDHAGRLSGLIYDDSEPINRWAEGVYDDYHRIATPVRARNYS